MAFEVVVGRIVYAARVIERPGFQHVRTHERGRIGGNRASEMNQIMVGLSHKTLMGMSMFNSCKGKKGDVNARKSAKKAKGPLIRLGNDLLSHVLRRSTISAGSFHGRVRYGIVCLSFRDSHQAR